jgi:hypothetical protein
MILLSNLLNEIGDTAQSFVPRNQIHWTVGKTSSPNSVLRGDFEAPSGLLVRYRLMQTAGNNWYFVFSVGGEIEKGADTSMREYLGILATVAEVLLKFLEDGHWPVRSIDITGSDKQGTHSGQKNRIYLQVFKRYEPQLRQLGYQLKQSGGSLTIIPV